MIKRGLVVFDPMQVAAIRLLVTSLFLMPFIIFGYQKLPKGKFKYIVLSGVVGSALPAFFFPLAQTQIESSLAGILNSMTPIFTLLIGLFFFNLALNKTNVGGIIFGFAGAALLILTRGETSLQGDVLFALFALMGAICYGLNTNLLKTYLSNVPPTLIASGSFAFLGFPAAGYLATTDFLHVVDHDHFWISFLAIAVIGIVGTGLAMVLFNILLQRTHPLFASSGTYLIPLVAVFWGFLDGEMIKWVHLIGIALILSGIYLTRKR